MFNKAKKNQEMLENEITRSIEVALESNKLYYFLLGIGFYKIYTPAYAPMIVNTAGIMESLYRYSKNVRNIQSEVQTAFEMMASIKTFYAVDATMELVYYHMEQEKNGRASFSLDCKKILEILSNNIKENLDFYKAAGELEDRKLDNGIYPIIQEFDTKFENNHNQKLL